MEDILAEARRRAPIEDRPAPKPEPPISMTPTGRSPRRPGLGSGYRQAAPHDTTSLPPGSDGWSSLLKMQKVARQLHEHKGYYWRKWRQAMRQALRRRRRPPTPTKRQ